jgi:hypothetical protein
MNRSPINPGKVVWSGENPIVSLKADAQGDELTNVTLFRIVYSPAGIGHAAFVSSRSFGGVLRGFTDNLELGRWLRDQMLPHYAHYTGRDGSTIPLSDARFAHAGDSRHRWEERITSDDTEVRLHWEDLGPPFVVNSPGGSTGKFPFHVISVFIPARRAGLTVNGMAAEGRPFPRDIAGTQSSTCFLAFSETWLTLPR